MITMTTVGMAPMRRDARPGTVPQQSGGKGPFIRIITVRNEVAKVMFLHVSVILSTGEGAIPACIAGDIPACLAAGFRGGVACSWGGLLPGGCLLQGGLLPGGYGEPLKANGYCCGWYTSYWNAFLFITQLQFFSME